MTAAAGAPPITEANVLGRSDEILSCDRHSKCSVHRALQVGPGGKNNDTDRAVQKYHGLKTSAEALFRQDGGFDECSDPVNGAGSDGRRHAGPAVENGAGPSRSEAAGTEKPDKCCFDCGTGAFWRVG
jgi:hypothetical protein